MIPTARDSPPRAAAPEWFAPGPDAREAAPSRAVGSCVKAPWRSQLAAVFRRWPPFAFFHRLHTNPLQTPLSGLWAKNPQLRKGACSPNPRVLPGNPEA